MYNAVMHSYNASCCGQPVIDHPGLQLLQPLYLILQQVKNFQNATSLSCKHFNSIFLSKTWLDFPLKLHQLKPSQSLPDSLSWKKQCREVNILGSTGKI
jgi:hypothetical protein